MYEVVENLTRDINVNVSCTKLANWFCGTFVMMTNGARVYVSRQICGDYNVVYKPHECFSVAGDIPFAVVC